MQISFDESDLGAPSDAQEIGGTSFGVKYTGYRNIARFLEQTEDIEYGMIHWPGGAFAETNDGRFGFEHTGLMNPNLWGRPALEDVFELANSQGLAVAITLPTAKYQNDPDALAAEAESFFTDLYSGEFGPLPDQLIIELGNEYYGAFSGSNETAQAEDYANVVNAYADLINDIEAQFNVNPDQIEYSIQIGTTEEASTEILDTLSDDALLIADFLSHHRYPFEPRGADARIDEVDDILNAFGDEINELGGEDPGLFVSEYNSASFTRNEAANKYLAESDDPTLSWADLDLSGRTNTEFEQFYQDQLGIRTYGIGQAENVLQIFSEYQGIGAEALTSYGWDSTYPGRNTFEGEDGESYTFVGGAIKDMMAESLMGTRVLDLYQDNKFGRGFEDDVAQYGFASPDKLVFFLVAPENLTDPIAIDFDLTQIGPVQAVWGQSLTAETPDNWHDLFDVPEVAGVDQSNEAATYAVAELSETELDLDNNTLQFEFYEPGEVVQLTFARTDAGEDEIREWHGDDMLVLEGLIDIDDTSPVDIGAPVEEPVEVPDEEPVEQPSEPVDEGTGGRGEPVFDFDFPTIEFPESEPEAEEEEEDPVDDSTGFAIEASFGALMIPALLALAGI